MADFAAQWQREGSIAVSIQSVGGVNAARRVRSSHGFDVVVLALDAINSLIAAGNAAGSSKVDLASSGVAAALKAGAIAPDISTESALRRAIAHAPSVGCSTGPSGAVLLALIGRWGLLGTVQSRMVQAPPGAPVAELVARGEVALGFQQLSELMHVDEITGVGTLPRAVAITSVVSAAICAVSVQHKAAAQLLVFMASKDAGVTKERCGMQQTM